MIDRRTDMRRRSVAGSLRHGQVARLVGDVAGEMWEAIFPGSWLNAPCAILLE